MRADAYYNYAVAQMLAQNGEFKEAIAAIQDALKRDPDSAFLWATLAQWYGRIDAPTDAIAAARKAVDLAPGQVAAHMTLAELLRAQRMYPEAEAELEKAIALNPDAEDGYSDPLALSG